MILLDIHIWTWWINDTDRKAFTKYLFGVLRQLVESLLSTKIGIIACFG
jgi:PIN domain nuclease of toxin-antitoxin system